MMRFLAFPVLIFIKQIDVKAEELTKIHTFLYLTLSKAPIQASCFALLTSLKVRGVATGIVTGL